MTRILSLIFAALLAGVGAYMLITDVHRAGTPHLVSLVGGGVLLFLAGCIIDPGDMQTAGKTVLDGLARFFGRGGGQ